MSTQYNLEDTTPHGIFNHINDLLVLVNQFPLDKLLEEDLTLQELKALSSADRFIVPQSYRNTALFQDQLKEYLKSHPNKRVVPDTHPRIKMLDFRLYTEVKLRVLFTRGELKKYDMYHFMRMMEIIPDMYHDWEYFIDRFLGGDKPVEEVVGYYEIRKNRAPKPKAVTNRTVKRWVESNPTRFPSAVEIGISEREFRQHFGTAVISADINHNQVIEESVSDLAEQLLASELIRATTKGKHIYKSDVDYFCNSVTVLTVERRIAWLTKKQQ